MTEKIMIISSLLAALALAAPASAARLARPDADALLLRALSAPATGYRAVERVQVFEPGRKPRALRLTRVASADGGVRLEIPAGRAKKASPLVYARRAGRASLLWPARSRYWDGPLQEEAPERSLRRLRAFYEVSVSTGGQVAKRKTWRADLRDARGRLRRSLWTDRASGILLKSESYRLDGALERRRRVSRLEAAAPEAAEFAPSAPAGVRATEWTAPEFPDPKSRRPESSAKDRLPRWVPDRFLLVDLRLSADGSRIHADYSDGASNYALTEEDAARPFAPKGARVVARDGAASLTLVEDAGRLSMAAVFGSRRYLVSGDLQEDEMARVLESVPGAP